MRSARGWALAATFVAVAALATPTVAQAHQSSSGASPASPNFSGTVALSNCSGAIVRWKSSVDTDKAMVLTNGHCHAFMGQREVVVNQPEVRGVDLLNSDGSVAGTVNTTTLLYATMWKTDVSLYQLNQTYAQLQSTYGVPAITVADTRPSPKDQPISVISGYWRLEYDCNLNGFAYRLLENGWTWFKSLRYSDGGCQVIGGTSGSPILNTDRVEIGINNTINEDGGRCTLDNPCEKDKHGNITVHLHRGYGQETWIFYTCLDGTTLNLNKQGCKLPSP